MLINGSRFDGISVVERRENHLSMFMILRCYRLFRNPVPISHFHNTWCDTGKLVLSFSATLVLNILGLFFDVKKLLTNSYIFKIASLLRSLCVQGPTPGYPEYIIGAQIISIESDLHIYIKLITPSRIICQRNNNNNNNKVVSHGQDQLQEALKINSKYRSLRVLTWNSIV